MSIRSFSHFMADPKGYLSFHKVAVLNHPDVTKAMDSGALADCLGSGLKMQSWTQKAAGPFLSMVHLVGHNDPINETLMSRLRSQFHRLPGREPLARSFRLIESAVDIGFRWLPFVENCCAYARFPNATASFIITGPLSGCTVAVGTHGGDPVVLHANCNRASGDAARMNQAQMIVNAARGGLNISAGSLRDAVYRRDYDGFGFVFGRKTGGGGWKFYAYGTATGVRKIGEF